VKLAQPFAFILRTKSFRKLKHSIKITAIVLLVLILDQTLKIWVKTTLAHGDSIFLFGWERAQIHFVENNGMAFGLALGGEYGKLALSLFRILAVSFLIYYLRILIKNKAPFGLLFSFACILAGAIGNIIDSAFYGLIFSESCYHCGIAELFPEGGGYAGFLHGRVVDMLYFPVLRGNYPDWFPLWGGESFTFFSPVFNLADTAITVGVLYILLFQRSFFSTHHPAEDTVASLKTDAVATGTNSDTEEQVEQPTPVS